MRAFANSVVLLVVLALVPRRIAAQCAGWCEENTKPNKCAFSNCVGCLFCLCDSSCGASSDPWDTKCSQQECSACPECTALSTCPPFCTKNTKPWSTKCKWATCDECPECTTPAAPSPGTGGACSGFCSRNQEDWATKCGWENCSGCSECSNPGPPPPPPPPPPGPRPKKPNVLLIFADDIGTGDVAGYWNNKNDGVVDMPNLWALANKGALFTDAHATPVCATSRYALLSGNYPHRGRNSGGTWLLGQPSQFLDGQKSIADVLRDDGGYHTSMVGKWHVGGEIPAAKGKKATTSSILLNPDNDWSKPLVQGPQTLGFDSSLITDKGIQSNPYVFFRDGFLQTRREDVRYWQVGEYEMPSGLSKVIEPGQGDKDWDSTAYNMILVKETERFLDEHFATRPEDPFFAYVALGMAHEPHSPPDEYINGEQVAGATQNDFLDMLVEMDKVVGSLVGFIEDRGIEEDTIIIFTSDNGGLPDADTNSERLGHKTQGPLNGFKGTVSEGGHRVPFLMRWDGMIPAGVERTHIVGIMDIFATLCEIAGISIPSGSAVDSVSFADYATSNDRRGLREYIGVWKDTRGGDPRSWSIRYNNFKLKYYYNTNRFLFHDLDKDIGEKDTLTWDSQYAGLIQQMRDEVSRLRPE